jgi:hypothetical protein
MTNYTVTSPVTGTVHTRNSNKSHYTHAAMAAARRADGTIVERVSFCGSVDKADKAATTHYRNLATFQELTMIGSGVVALEGK